MKFRFVESLNKATPYMLRNDGELFPCGSIHPYIIKDGESIDDMIQNGMDIDALYWFYTHSKSETTKKLIRVVAKYFIDKFGIDDKYTISIYGNNINDIDFNIDDNIYQAKIGEIESFIQIVSDDTNQEFCRVRTSNKLWGGTSNSIYFRISSIGFNWFPIIWDIVNKYRNNISDVTICKDSSVFGGAYEPYIISGERIESIGVEDFLTLSGNPIVEGKKHEMEAINYAREKMSLGCSVSESYDWLHPRHAHGFYIRQLKDCLEFERNSILQR